MSISPTKKKGIQLRSHLKVIFEKQPEFPETVKGNTI